MTLLCDLHTHSVFSDGTYTPTQIVEKAEEIGLAAVALCDHNCVGGVRELVKAAENKKVEAIPGIELSVDYAGIELHLLALYIPLRHMDKYTAYVDQARKHKEESNIALVVSLRRAGYDVDYDSILARSSGDGFNRVHVAMLLMERGYLSSVEEGFETILSPEAGYYKPPKRPDVYETLHFICSTGAVPVLAHPFLNLKEHELRNFLKAAVLHGLAGMETHYSAYNAETTEKSIRLAGEFDLLQSGGSDFHGENKPAIALGSGCGSLAVPYAFAKAIRAVSRD